MYQLSITKRELNDWEITYNKAVGTDTKLMRIACTKWREGRK